MKQVFSDVEQEETQFVHQEEKQNDPFNCSGFLPAGTFQTAIRSKTAGKMWQSC